MCAPVLDMVMDEDKRKVEKRAKSEAQRLASIRAKKELEKQRKAILSKALREVDQKSKRVVFTDSDNEDNPPSSSQAGAQKPLAAHVKLFEDSSSDENEEDTITITNRHEGKKGEKLMKLEARFNSDSRFKLDEKFVSSGSDDEEEDEVNQERAKHLEVLSRVLGSTVKPQKKTLKSSENVSKGQTKVRPFTRFDPFNEEHVRWLKKEEEIRNGANDDDSTEEATVSAETEEGSKKNGIHYEMQPDFAEELKARLAAEASTSESANGKANFSFLAMLGRKDKSEENCETRTENDPAPSKKMKLALDNTDNEESADAKVVVPEVSKSTESDRHVTRAFFVTGNEEHLRSLVSNFRRTQPLERIVPQWGNHRDVFAKNYKHLRKEALKKNRQNVQSNGKDKKKKGEKSSKRGVRESKSEQDSLPG